MSEIIARPSTAADASQIRRLRLEALLDAPAAYGTRHEEVVGWSEQQWLDMATSPSSFVVLVDDEIIGIARGGTHDGEVDSTNRWLWGMYVTPASRGTGAAQVLIEAVAEWSRADGGSALCLYVSTAAPRARTLYEKVGFVATGIEFDHDARPELRFCEMRMTL